MAGTASAELKADASLTLAPTKSQGFLIGGLVMEGVIVAASGFMFYLKNQNAGYAFLGLSGFVFCGLFYCWHRAQRDADLDGARATQIKTATGVTISTDPRVLSHANAVDGLARLLEAAQRQPLPTANGLVVNGQVVENSEHAAREQTALINAQSQATANAVLDGLGLSQASDVVRQEGLLSVPPPMPITNVDEVNTASK